MVAYGEVSSGRPIHVVLEVVSSGLVTFDSLSLSSNHFVQLTFSRRVISDWGVVLKIFVINFHGLVSNLDLLGLLLRVVISVSSLVLSGKVELTAKVWLFESGRRG